MTPNTPEQIEQLKKIFDNMIASLNQGTMRLVDFDIITHGERVEKDGKTMPILAPTGHQTLIIEIFRSK